MNHIFSSRSLMRALALAILSFLAGPLALQAVEPPVFQVGFAKRDITPQEPMPMWGYGDRHDKLSEGVIHPLLAKAIVIPNVNQRQ